MKISSTFVVFGCPTAFKGDGVASIYHLESIFRDNFYEPMLTLTPATKTGKKQIGSEIAILEYSNMQNYIFIKKKDSDGDEVIQLVEAYDYSAVNSNPRQEIYAQINEDFAIQDKSLRKFTMQASGNKLLYADQWSGDSV